MIEKTTQICQEMPKPGRNSNIEILRFILMAAIFFWHIIIHGFGFSDIIHTRYAGVDNYPVILFFASLFAPAVDCFVFISGYYGMKFSLKKLLSLVGLMIMAMAVISLKWIWMDGFSLRSLDILEQWYFMNCYLILFLIAPVINKGVECLSRRQFGLLIGVLLAFQLYSFIRCLGYGVEHLIIIYVIGQYCSKYDVTLNTKRSLFVFVGGLSVVYVLELLCSLTSVPAEFRLLSYKNPFVMLMGGALFFLFNSFRSRSIGWLNESLRPCLFIYLLTEGVSGLLYKPLAEIFVSNFLYGVLLSLTVILVCLVVGFVLHKVTDCIVNAIFRNKRLFALNVHSMM